MPRVRATLRCVGSSLKLMPTLPADLRSSSLHRRIFWAVYVGALVLILGDAPFLRFALPQTPIIDPDFWGYLHPAVSALTGGPFEHTYGRNFVYPGFLYLLLRVFGDYRAVCVAQHLLGLLTGILLAGGWNILCSLLTAPAWSRLAASAFGLVLAAAFLFTSSPLVFEHTIRPESVFPCFLAVSFVLNFTALRAGYVVRRPRLERWCLGLNLFFVVFAQSLKPSLGLGVVAANLPFAVYLLRPREPWRAKTLVVGAAVVFTFLTLWLPERTLASRDAEAPTFLPLTLFTVHARFIETQLAEDLRAGQTGPYDPAWLAAFDQRLCETLQAAAQPDQHPYRTLGINPDYLMYVDPFYRPSFRRRERAEISAFCLHYYRRTWEHQPGPMLRNVLTQLSQVYNFTAHLGRKHRLRHFFSLPGPSDPLPLNRGYRHAIACCQDPARNAQITAAPGGGSFLERLRGLADTNLTVRAPVWTDLFNRFLARWHLPLLILTLVLGAGLTACSWRANLPLVTGVWLLWAVNFLMYLTVAIVHSLEPYRYVENQRVCTDFAECSAFLLLWQAAALLLARLPVLRLRPRQPQPARTIPFVDTPNAADAR